MIRRHHETLIARSGNVDRSRQQQVSYPSLYVARLRQELPVLIEKVVFLTLFEPSLHTREDERLEEVCGSDSSSTQYTWIIWLGQIGCILEGCNVSRRKAIC